MSLPLEFRPDLIRKHGFDRDDMFLDLYQAYSVLRLGCVNFLYPDNANKIFANYYNNAEYGVFESFMYDISEHITFYYIKEGNFDSMETGVYIFNRSTKKLKKVPKKTKSKSSQISLTSDGKIKMDHNMIIMIEYKENEDFGHYGACFYKHSSTEIDIFESMYSVSIDDEYMENFMNIIRQYFDVGDKNFNTDVYRGDDEYPCEITGGAFGVYNNFIEGEFENRPDVPPHLRKLWYADMYIMGNDNQNQFCYMWTILYITSKVFNLKRGFFQWVDIHKFICQNNIIPVAFIKLFVSLTTRLKYIRENPHLQNLLSDDFFNEFFNTFTTNDLNYLFKLVPDRFFQVESPIGTLILQNKSVVTDNLLDCLNELNSIISQHKLPLRPLKCWNENTTISKYICHVLDKLPYIHTNPLFRNLCLGLDWNNIDTEIDIRWWMSNMSKQYADETPYESKITYDGFVRFANI